jgi:hypothetical protein
MIIDISLYLHYRQMLGYYDRTDHERLFPPYFKLIHNRPFV